MQITRDEHVFEGTNAWKNQPKNAQNWPKSTQTKKFANKRISKNVTFRPQRFPSARQVPAKQGEKCNNTADSIPQLFKTI